jgi:hypothetical protein
MNGMRIVPETMVQLIKRNFREEASDGSRSFRG